MADSAKGEEKYGKRENLFHTVEPAQPGIGEILQCELKRQKGTPKKRSANKFWPYLPVWLN
jgi:hypothetical protein